MIVVFLSLTTYVCYCWNLGEIYFDPLDNWLVL